MPASTSRSKRRRPAPAAAATAGSTKRARPDRAAAAAGETASLTKHVLSCIDWPVSGVAALAVAPDGRLLASARADGSLELRRAGPHAAPPACTVPPPPVAAGGAADAHIADSAISSLVFAGAETIVASRVDGTLEIFRVVDGHFLEATVALRLPGGALWAVAAHGRCIAVACDDRRVRIVRARNDDGPPFPADPAAYDVRSLPRGPSRVLCVAWADAGATLVAGDAKGGLRWLSAATGSVLGIGRLRGDVRIWCVAVAKRGAEIVAGDSTGRVTTWDAATHVLCDEIRIEALHGDVLSLAAVAPATDGRDIGETVLVASAGGSVGAIVAPPAARAGDRWAPVRAKRLHTHDVRALAVLPPQSGGGAASFVTGALDSTMCVLPVASLLREDVRPERIRPFASPSSQPHVQFIPRRNVVVARHASSVDVWRVYESESPALLFRLSLHSLGPNIRVCAVSDAMQVVVVSTPDAARVYRVEPVKRPGKPFAAKIEPLSYVRAGAAVHDALVGVSDVVFVGKQQDVVAVAPGAKSLVVCSGLAPPRARAEQRAGPLAVLRVSMADLGCAADTHRLVRVVASPGKDRRFAVSDSAGRVAVVDLLAPGAEGDRAPLTEVVMAHSARGFILSMAFTADGSRLAVACSKAITVVLNVANGHMSRLRIAAQYAHTSTSLSFSLDMQSVVASGPRHCIVAKVGPLESQLAADARGAAAPADDSGAESTARSKVDRAGVFRERMQRAAEAGLHHHLGHHENILATSVLGTGDLVLVQRPWDMVVPTLPRAIKRKVFGT